MAYANLNPEDKARHELINPALKKAGWVIQHFKSANVFDSKGIAVEFFPMGWGVGKEPQTAKYAKSFPKDFRSVDLPLPFVYETSGSEIRFTNWWDPKPRSREVFHFHTPDELEA